MNTNHEHRHLYLGDSYTIGTGVTADQRWPELLQQSLLARGEQIAPATLFARNGWTTTDLLLALHHATPIKQYERVFLMIGVNDQYQGLPETGVWLRFARLLKAAIGFSQYGAKGVGVISVPDWSYSPFGRRFSSNHSQAAMEPVAMEINAYNQQQKLMSEAAGVTWIDVTQISRDSNTSTDFADDGLHPSAGQYQRWVDDAILPVLQRLQPCSIPSCLQSATQP